jgi:hypothetical protein
VEPLVFTGEGDGHAPIAEGGPLELWAAPQGGHWSRVGARVVGLGTDTAELVARLRDPTSGALVAEATRTAPMVPVPGSPDVKHPDPTNMYNVVHLPLCPGDDSRGLAGATYHLEVQVTELYGDFSQGAATLTVVPTCTAPAGPLLDYCACECAADYVPGKCAGPTNG